MLIKTIQYASTKKRLVKEQAQRGTSTAQETSNRRMLRGLERRRRRSFKKNSGLLDHLNATILCRAMGTKKENQKQKQNRHWP
jgi:hypothetical protein